MSQLCPAQTATTRPTTTRPATVRVPEYASTARIPERLLNDQAGQIIVLPSEPGEIGEERAQLSGGALGRVVPEIRPLPEGFVVARRPARLERQGEWLIARLERVPGLAENVEAPPIRILPNSRLAMLESIMADLKEAPRFAITGRVTEFQGVNYVLLDNLAEIAHSPVAAAPPRPAQPLEPGPAGADASTRPSTGREPSAEDLIQELMQDKPLRPVMPPEERRGSPEVTTAPATEASPSAGEGTRWAEEILLSDRAARLVPGDTWWTLAFDDPGKNAKDRPVRVLPSRLLETAIGLTAGGTRNTVLIVSGETTAYKGTNYLLLRKVLVRRDMGNFR